LGVCRSLGQRFEDSGDAAGRIQVKVLDDFFGDPLEILMNKAQKREANDQDQRALQGFEYRDNT